MKVSSKAFVDCAARATSGRSQPTTCRSVAYLRSASANDPPINPVPRIDDARDEMSGHAQRKIMALGDFAADGRSDDAKLIHQLRKLRRVERLRAVG